jgi:hypothetical protein
MYHVAKGLKSRPRTWADTLVQPKQRKRDMRFGTWYVRSMYRAGSLLDWIELAQDRDRWRALVNAVMNLWVT